MRKQRTIYFNDARHYYLFVFEPPMNLEDARKPIDEVAGTSVDTFSYGVERGDGLFYPSKRSMRFGEDIQPFDQAAYWRVWNNMQSLIDKGLDPLEILIDRAHEKGMEFLASVRLGSSGGLDPKLNTKTGGRGFVEEIVRDHVFGVLEELATEYKTDGLELDFAAPPGGASFYFQPEDVTEYTPVMTDWVKQVSKMVRGSSGTCGEIGARIYPTREANEKVGLDVVTWLEERLIDFVVPMVYGHNVVDADMPIDWLIDTAHQHDISVYPMIAPYYMDDSRVRSGRQHATPEMIRAATSSYWNRGADGMYTWFLNWPLGDAERTILTELGDQDLALQGNQHYVVRRSSDYMNLHGIGSPLPLEIPSDEIGTSYPVDFYLAEDVVLNSDRISGVTLRVNIKDLVSADCISLYLNGSSLSHEVVSRHPADIIAPYVGQWLEFQLSNVLPKKGTNTLEIVLNGRAEGLISPLVVEDVEIVIQKTFYPPRLTDSSHSNKT